MTATAITERYRPALDGVRAVAVLAVIGYHLNSHLPGGFLGVDVFFVLSGYLITTLLLRELSGTDGVRVLGFWARRARRLLPAVLLLLAVVAVVVARSAPLSTLPARRDDLLSTLFYVANWHFIASDQSYFAAYAGASPLRHMWSLAIEEQFYLLWPIVLLAAWRLGRARRGAVLAVVVAGAVVSAVALLVHYDPANPSRAYFGTDTRAYVLLVGAALAILVDARPALLTGARAATVARWSWPVVTLIVAVGFLRLGDQDPIYYRGGALLFALVVAWGLWVIEALPRGWPARVLSMGPMRWTGRISYGLYLWHWPLILWIGASTHLPSWAAGPRSVQVVEVAATFAVATASFYLLERPVRTGRVPWLRRSGRRLALAAPAAMAVVAALILTMSPISGGSSLARDIADTSDPGPCTAGGAVVGGRFSWCATAPRSDRSPVVAVIGDSTGRALFPGMQRVAADRGWRYVQAAQGGCSFVPLLFLSSIDRAGFADKQPCLSDIPALHAQVAAAYRPDVWIVSDRFLGNPLGTADGRVLNPGDPRRHRIVLDAMRAKLAQLTAGGAQVVLLAVPPLGQPADCATGRAPQETCAAPQYSTRDVDTAEINRLIAQAARGLRNSVSVVRIDDILCPDGLHCPAVVSGMLARYDSLHFTGTFSRRIVPLVLARAQRAGVRFRRHG
jgi:peptidoglycan/LPS O-acetylase OafA/YrhL